MRGGAAGKGASITYFVALDVKNLDI